MQFLETIKLFLMLMLAEQNAKIFKNLLPDYLLQVTWP